MLKLHPHTEKKKRLKTGCFKVKSAEIKDHTFIVKRALDVTQRIVYFRDVWESQLFMLILTETKFGITSLPTRRFVTAVFIAFI